MEDVEEPEFEEGSLGEKKPFKPAFLVDTKGWKFNREECYEERLARFFKDENNEEAG